MDTGGLGSLLWLLALGALFYFMMRRGGCGGHARHEEGSSEHKGHGGAAGSRPKDPVCGMEVEAEKAKTSVYGGETYYFCSPACRDRFEAEPTSYAGRTRSGGCC